MKLLLLFIFLVFGGGMLIVSLLKGVSQLIFGKPCTANAQSRNNRDSMKRDAGSSRQAQKKIFGENEGEYVKFEEVED